MGIMVGGTIEDLARSEVTINFTFEPKGTKKSLDEIFKARRITNEEMRRLCQQEADLMVERRFMLYDGDGVHTFSKDDQGNYFWREATKAEKIMGYLGRLVN